MESMLIDGIAMKNIHFGLCKSKFHCTCVNRKYFFLTYWRGNMCCQLELEMRDITVVFHTSVSKIEKYVEKQTSDSNFKLQLESSPFNMLCAIQI